MGQYGDVAVAAARACAAGVVQNPRRAWQTAVERATRSATSRRKGCPRDAFLGLCGEGMVTGIGAGEYLQPTAWKNKQYAVNIAQWLLSREDAAAVDADQLWNVARRGVEDPAENQNGQLDVVVSLHTAGLLVESVGGS